MNFEAASFAAATCTFGSSSSASSLIEILSCTNLSGIERRGKMYQRIRQLLFLINPETVHHLAVAAIKVAWQIPFVRQLIQKRYAQRSLTERTVAGIRFPNPVGLAAGFDKNASFFHQFFSFGFGFIEIGTVTPLAQPGNEKPRLFRLPLDRALINRMGFNNEGCRTVLKNIEKNKRPGMIVGGNIGKNKATPLENAAGDYLTCFKELYPSVDYFVINVSSPNTPGLRQLQEREPLLALLEAVQTLNRSMPLPRPLFVKIAPDLSQEALQDMVGVIKESAIDGVVIGNTTLSRENLRSSERLTSEAGGLSGEPLRERSTSIIRFMRSQLPPPFAIIGAGGIMSPSNALEKLTAGADLVQIYTGFVYEGPSLIKKIIHALALH